MHTDPDWRKLWTVLPFCKLCRTLHFACLCSLFVLFILTCVLLLLCDIRLQFENYVDCWPRGVSCFWTRLNCAPVFSTFLLSIGKDRGIVLREQNYMRSRAVGSQRSKLRRKYWICAGWVCKRFSGQVRAEWFFYSNRLHRPPQGIPSGWTRSCRRSGFWFLMSIFIITYIRYIYTHKYMLGVAQI